MFRGYVSNARRARGSIVKDRGTIAPTVIASMVRSTSRWVDRLTCDNVPWRLPRAGRFDLVLVLLASRWFAFGRRTPVGSRRRGGDVACTADELPWLHVSVVVCTAWFPRCCVHGVCGSP